MVPSNLNEFDAWLCARESELHAAGTIFGSVGRLSSAPFPKGHLLRDPAPVSICVWCAMERALQGHGPAPSIRGLHQLEPCARHV